MDALQFKQRKACTVSNEQVIRERILTHSAVSDISDLFASASLAHEIKPIFVLVQHDVEYLCARFNVFMQLPSFSDDRPIVACIPKEYQNTRDLALFERFLQLNVKIWLVDSDMHNLLHNVATAVYRHCAECDDFTEKDSYFLFVDDDSKLYYNDRENKRAIALRDNCNQFCNALMLNNHNAPKNSNACTRILFKSMHDVAIANSASVVTLNSEHGSAITDSLTLANGVYLASVIDLCNILPRYISVETTENSVFVRNRVESYYILLGCAHAGKRILTDNNYFCSSAVHEKTAFNVPARDMYFVTDNKFDVAKFCKVKEHINAN